MPNFIISALLGPRLYWYYGCNGRAYQANLLESSGNKMFTLGNCIYNTVCMLSFIVIPYVLTTWTPSGYGTAARAAVTFYVLAYSLRTTGRLTNSDYKQFISELERAKTDPANVEFRAALKLYDFQVAVAPPDFIAQPAQDKWFHRLEQGQISELSEPLNSLRAFVGWMATNTVGRRLLYPGSLAFLQSMINSALIDRRQKLIQEKGAQRNILFTEEGDKLDTVFVDNRGQGRNGDILIICCEGNAGFYETGVMKTPLELEYSVLGWNMPGFAESSGTPYPKSLLFSMEAVMQFAIQKCGFRPEKIVLYAWSIGGFPGTWAAANYPQIRALILDASFDDLVPLAVAKMPEMFSGIVRYTIQKHLNLPISKQLNRYKGPVVLIRRWDEEIIVTEMTTEEERRASNRANWLLLKLIDHRYPGLIASNEDEQCVFDWLARDPQSRLIDFPPEDSEEPTIPLDTDFATLEGSNRMRLIHQLCSKYFIDYMYATHNEPLKPEYFNIPREIG